MASRRPERNRRTPALGARLHERRTGLGLSQREVSELTNNVVSYAGLSRIECGFRYPSLYTLEYLAEALNCRIVIDKTGTSIEW